jgi:hypothetical protein
LIWNALRDETITPIGLPSVSNSELLFELDDVMAGIGIECKKNLTFRDHKVADRNRPNGRKVVVAGSGGSFREDARTASIKGYDAQRIYPPDSGNARRS